jgi:hypothetical protein
MSSLLGVVIPAVLGFLAAYQGGLTRTGRLRSIIRANVELLGSLPADHPSRAPLSAHIEELVGMLVRRQRRRFEPITRAGAWFGVNTTLALLMVATICWTALQLAGVWEPEPLTRQDHRQNIIYYTVFAVCFVGFALRAWLHQRREHPESARRAGLSGTAARA